MALNIGRQGWTGIALEASPNTPTSPSDYLQFTANTLYGKVNNENISNATQNRIKVFDSAPTKKWGEGELDWYADPKYTPYFLGAALGTYATSTVSGSIKDHLMTVKNTNSTPQTLTVINQRTSIEQQAFYSAVVDSFELAVSDGLATCKANLITNFPQTTTSGTATTASGTVFAFPSASFAFGSTVAAADLAALGSGNLKPHEFNLSIKNNAKAVFRFGNMLPDTINVGDFEISANYKLYFENTTDRDAYYNSSKQAAELAFVGKGIGAGFFESLKFRWYRTRLDSYAVETGLSNFFIEDVTMQPEYDNANSIAFDAVARNLKTLYI